MNRSRRFINIKDKEELNNNTYCPPHYIPHRLPFGEKITDEPCHIHDSRLRMAHHKLFCKILKCKNYETMIKFSEESKR